MYFYLLWSISLLWYCYFYITADANIVILLHFCVNPLKHGSNKAVSLLLHVPLIIFYPAKNSKASRLRPDVYLLKVAQSAAFVWCSRLLRSCIKVTYCCGLSREVLSSHLGVSDRTFTSADTWPTLVMIDRKRWFISPPHTLMGSHSSFFLSHSTGEEIWSAAVHFYRDGESFCLLRHERADCVWFSLLAVLCNNQLWLFVLIYTWCKSIHSGFISHVEAEGEKQVGSAETARLMERYNEKKKDKIEWDQ